jgi:DNA-directed RNA polymerase subunit RPC12/RpoP
VIHTVQRDVVLQHYRCWDCGRYWACDTHGPNASTCPVCAKRRIEAIIKHNDELGRQVSALKGVITKLRKP